ncbi:MAG: hypothetical protein JW837_06955, partial [Sedimentisphaerales bacterium]|nr:hypothetical protein [Sedimentisphaerales bacterium]
RMSYKPIFKKIRENPWNPWLLFLQNEPNFPRFQPKNKDSKPKRTQNEPKRTQSKANLLA